MKKSKEKKCASLWLIRFVFLFLLVLALGACTSTGKEKPKKWKPKERAQSHVELGISYLKRGQHEVAREEFDLALAIDPNSDQALHGKGLLLAQTGYIEDAKRLFARAVRVNKSNFVAINDYGTFLCQNHDLEKGVEVLGRIESKPDNNYLSNTRLGLGVCYMAQGQLAPAKRYFRAVLEEAPRLPQALLPMAEIAFQEQNYLSARAFIERYISIGALSEKALVLGANTEIQLGDTQKGQEYVRELRRVYPNSTQLEKFKPLLGSG